MTETISAKEFIDEQVKIAKKRGSKYRNVKTVVDGITFDSKKEAQRYAELRMMELGGEIYSLIVQHEFSLEINGHKICKYKCDFMYQDLKRKNTMDESMRRQTYIVEDVKSPITRKNPVYRIKKKLMKAIYGIDILET